MIEVARGGANCGNLPPTEGMTGIRKGENRNTVCGHGGGCSGYISQMMGRLQWQRTKCTPMI